MFGYILGALIVIAGVIRSFSSMESWANYLGITEGETRTLFLVIVVILGAVVAFLGYAVPRSIW